MYGQSKKARGFTLIETMIAVIVVGVLMALAYSSYQNQVMRTRRSEGMTALMNTAQTLERCFTRFGNYNNGGCNTGLPFTTENGYYAISAPTITASGYSLAATPAGGQVGDAQCGVLRLAHTGQEARCTIRRRMPTTAGSCRCDCSGRCDRCHT
jgi:type IV pilus assembly protein PilE